MNKWRDSCIRGQDNLKSKVERFEKEAAMARAKYGGANGGSQTSLAADEQRCKELLRKLETIVSEKEPLIISIISTVYEDLKEIHR